jgi:hypothetical protein
MNGLSRKLRPFAFRVAVSMPLKNDLQQGCVCLSALVDCFERGIEFLIGRFDRFRKETNAGMIRNYRR